MASIENENKTEWQSVLQMQQGFWYLCMLEYMGYEARIHQLRINVLNGYITVTLILKIILLIISYKATVFLWYVYWDN